MNFHNFEFTSIDGQPLPAKSFAGKAVLVVNTASFCGFTKQYAGLQALWQKYRDRGFLVLGVPSNDFGAQEPGTASEIKTFCETNFAVDFPLAGKLKVTGPDAHPFYKWAAGEVGVIGSPKWNFHKYLIAPDGRLVDWFSTATAPDAGRMIKAVEAVLPK
ncbi:MAG: glutathione peroxidase [Proteobacteria bacterium]|nr:glutathione peroxidase [Pseudomonadota bacterium]